MRKALFVLLAALTLTGCATPDAASSYVPPPPRRIAPPPVAAAFPDGTRAYAYEVHCWVRSLQGYYWRKVYTTTKPAEPYPQCVYLQAASYSPPDGVTLIVFGRHGWHVRTYYPVGEIYGMPFGTPLAPFGSGFVLPYPYGPISPRQCHYWHRC